MAVKHAMTIKTVAQSEKETKKQEIILQSGLSIEDLSSEMGPFIESVSQQIESEDPTMQETATLLARECAGKMLATGEMLGLSVEGKRDVLTVRDRIAELYFAYLHLAKRIREAVQQAETMARRQERFAEIIRSNIEAWMLTSWDAKKITGHYREFRITKNPDKVMVIDEEQIPEEYFDPVPATKVLNKTRLAEGLKEERGIYLSAIEAGLSEASLAIVAAEIRIPGALLETNRTRLDIK